MTVLRLQTRSSIQSQERNLVKSSHCFTKATKQDPKVLSVPKDFNSPTKCHIHYAYLVYIYRCNTYRLCLYDVYIILYIYSVAFRLCRPFLLENPCSEFASFARTRPVGTSSEHCQRPEFFEGRNWEMVL